MEILQKLEQEEFYVEICERIDEREIDEVTSGHVNIFFFYNFKQQKQFSTLTRHTGGIKEAESKGWFSLTKPCYCYNCLCSMDLVSWCFFSLCFLACHQQGKRWFTSWKVYFSLLIFFLSPMSFLLYFSFSSFTHEQCGPFNVPLQKNHSSI